MICNNINPALYDCSDLENTLSQTEDEIVLPSLVRLTIEEAESTKLCLLDDGFSLFLYIIDEDFVAQKRIFEGEGYSEDNISEHGFGAQLRVLVNELRS